ncbi:hypothetical protein Sjap_004280 [Stephania japonica]|uniref:Uncharacterized protein n=1 Tax=Stephania japonica TaxID=461633 RepID=A0AAP0K453_9MAGN
MTDQRGLNDDNRKSSPRAVSIEEFQTLTQRVAAQERQLEEILAILRASVTAASVTSTARVTVTQGANTPGVTTMIFLPTTTAMRPVMAVIPHAPTEIAPATPTMYGTTATTEAKQWREFKRHDPDVFYGGTDVTAAEFPFPVIIAALSFESMPGRPREVFASYAMD